MATYGALQPKKPTDPEADDLIAAPPAPPQADPADAPPAPVKQIAPTAVSQSAAPTDTSGTAPAPVQPPSGPGYTSTSPAIQQSVQAPPPPPPPPPVPQQLVSTPSATQSVGAPPPAAPPPTDTTQPAPAPAGGPPAAPPPPPPGGQKFGWYDANNIQVRDGHGGIGYMAAENLVPQLRGAFSQQGGFQLNPEDMDQVLMPWGLTGREIQEILGGQPINPVMTQNPSGYGIPETGADGSVTTQPWQGETGPDGSPTLSPPQGGPSGWMNDWSNLLQFGSGTGGLPVPGGTPTPPPQQFGGGGGPPGPGIGFFGDLNAATAPKPGAAPGNGLPPGSPTGQLPGGYQPPGGQPPFTVDPNSLIAPPPATAPTGGGANPPPTTPVAPPPGAPGSPGYPSGQNGYGGTPAPAFAPDQAWDAGVNALDQEYERLWDRGQRNTLENMASRGTIDSSIEAGAYGELDADLRAGKAQGLATLARQRSDDSFRERTMQAEESRFSRSMAEQVASRLQQESQFGRGLQSEENRDMLARQIQRESLELQRQGMARDDAYRTASLNAENYFKTESLRLQAQGMSADDAFRKAELDWRKSASDKDFAMRDKEANTNNLLQMYQMLMQFAPWMEKFIDPKTGMPKNQTTQAPTPPPTPAPWKNSGYEWDQKYGELQGQDYDDNYIRNYLGQRPAA